MTTVNPAAPRTDVAPETPTRPQLGSGVLAGWRALRDALDKPLASYYLLLGVVGAAAHHRPDHGAERVERAVLRSSTTTPTPS